MSRSTRLVLAFLGAVALTGALAGLSRVPYEADAADTAMIRLAWRVRGTRVEECRRLSDEELAALPPHMRRDEVCDGRILPYRLRVTLDGREVVDQLVEPAGTRADRPIYVLHELPVATGSHTLAISFIRQGSDSASLRTDEAAPAQLRLSAQLDLEGKAVALITYDPEAQRLVLRGGARVTGGRQ